MRYRREIDGLRALAVVPVILFHAGLAAVPGGYVGVDVFFVISGYLITGLIRDELERGTFSILRFYERRARRILPALALVVLCCIPFALMWMIPTEFKAFAASIAAVSIFASNILFWRESGYFGAAAEQKPLLHTWSLAVEEQYYVVFPLLLMALWRWRRHWVPLTMVALTVLSLAAAEWAGRMAPEANFYLFPFRAWELLIGGMAAMVTATRAPAPHPVAEVASLAGLVMIGWAMVAFDHNTRVPGLPALIPVGGTALFLLCATPKTLAGRVMGLAPFVGIGLISYSAYLWHQPLFAFARIRMMGDAPHDILLVLGAVSLVLAWLSWRFVEQPFRDRGRVGRRAILAMGLAATVGMGALGLAAGLWADFSPRYRHYTTVTEPRLAINHGFGPLCEAVFTTTPECRTSDTPEIVVWGDSYAMHLVDGVAAAAKGRGVVQHTKSVCGPFIDMALVLDDVFNPQWAAQCNDFTRSVMDYIDSTPSLKVAILSSPFFNYVNPANRVLDGETLRPVTPDLAVARMTETLDWLRERGIRPVIVSPTPYDGRDIGSCLARQHFVDGDRSICNISAPYFHTINRSVDDFLDRLEAEAGAEVIRLSDTLCDATTCHAMLDDIFVYRDPGHLSHEGSRRLGELGIFDAALRP